MSKVLDSVLSTYPDRPNVAILMSGSGTNARALLSREDVRDHYNIAAIFTDNAGSNASAISQEYGLPYIERDKARFTSKEEREEYFRKALLELGTRGVNAAFFAGFMKVTSSEFANEVPGVNVHPADLTIVGNDGVAMHRGMHALSTMREQTGGLVAASVHVVDNPVDTGSVLAVSDALRCPPELADEECHKRLQALEHELFPSTLVGIAEGTITHHNIPILGAKS